jgi:SAM-dependent methyltransferase
VGEAVVAEHTYALGHSSRELERLSIQARLINPITRRFLAGAGILPGMRVLDVGCGAGDTSLLAASFVGDTGEVVGVDLSPLAIARARARATARSLPKVLFEVGDPAAIGFARKFDAVIGRYVLMFQPDPVHLLAGVVRHVRPGGIVMFHEVDWSGVRSMPPVPTYDLVCRWTAEVLAASGHHIRMGMRLPATFQAVGLPEPTLRLDAVIGAGTSAGQGMNIVGDLMPMLLPASEQYGIATAQEVDADTVAARMEQEAQATGSVVVGRSEIGAWATVPLTPPG